MTVEPDPDHEGEWQANDGDLTNEEEAGASADLVFEGLRVAFVGKLGGVNRREAHRLVRRHGGIPVERCELPLNLVVLGADQLPLSDESLISRTIQDRAAEGHLDIITETQFWYRLGMVENDLGQVRRLYTPAMLAQLLDVPLAVIRRWHRRGLIVPAREVHRLPYFDFQEVATARRLAAMLTAGAKPEAIERQLENSHDWCLIASGRWRSCPSSSKAASYCYDKAKV